MEKALGANSHVPSMAFMRVHASSHVQNPRGGNTLLLPVLLTFEPPLSSDAYSTVSPKYTIILSTQHTLRVLTKYIQYAPRCKLSSFLGAALEGRHPAPHPTRHTVPPCNRQNLKRTSSPAQKTHRRRQTSLASAQRTSSSKLSFPACRRSLP